MINFNLDDEDNDQLDDLFIGKKKTEIDLDEDLPILADAKQETEAEKNKEAKD